MFTTKLKFLIRLPQLNLIHLGRFKDRINLFFSNFSEIKISLKIDYKLKGLHLIFLIRVQKMITIINKKRNNFPSNFNYQVG